MELRVPFMTKGGVVASEHYLASKIGLEILERGGNVVDAAIATSFALSVTVPHMGGLGGDFFGLYYERKKEKVYCISSSGFAPKELTIGKVKSYGYLTKMPSRGPLSISVPGYVYGVFEFHRRFGSKDFAYVVDPSIRLAKTGFPASKRFSNIIDKNKKLLQTDEGCRETFLGASKRINEGAVIKFPQVAKTLSLIRENGPKGFYEGEVANAIVDYVQSKGGVIKQEDLKLFKPEWVEPIKITYRGYEVYEVPPPSMGASTLLLLNLLEQYDIRCHKRLSAKYVDAFVKLAKKTYKARDENLSDPRFVKIDLEKHLSKGYAQQLLNESNLGSLYQNIDGDTTYFAVADKEGNIVSAIQSLFLGFGSGLTVPRYGIPLNSRASYFRFDGVNKLEPGKRTLHTLSVMILTNDSEVVALGASAGDYRPQVYAQLVANYIDFKLGLQGTIESPRFVWKGSNKLIVEEGVDTKRLHHYYRIQKTKFSSNLGVAQGVKVYGEIKWAACDIRGDGLPMGHLS